MIKTNLQSRNSSHCLNHFTWNEMYSKNWQFSLTMSQWKQIKAATQNISTDLHIWISHIYRHVCDIQTKWIKKSFILRLRAKCIVGRPVNDLSKWTFSYKTRNKEANTKITIRIAICKCQTKSATIITCLIDLISNLQMQQLQTHT